MWLNIIFLFSVTILPKGGYATFDCSSVSNCNGKKYLCNSKTSYQHCETQNGCKFPTGKVVHCKKGQICSDLTNDPCISPPPKEKIEGPFEYPSEKCECEGQIIPSTKDCRVYFVCTLDSCGKLQLQPKTCPFLQVYNVNKKKCVPSNLVNCGNAQPKDNVPNCDCQQTVPFETDPKKPRSPFYYQCERQQQTNFFARHIDCQSGFVFNETAAICTLAPEDYVVPKECGYKTEVKCSPECWNEKDLSVKPLYFTDKCESPGIYPDAWDCSRYVICVKNKQKEFEKFYGFCDNANFDPEKLVCSKQAKCLCSARKTDFKCTRVGIFSDPVCPSQYYLCRLTTAETFRPQLEVCPFGTVFDGPTHRCIPQNVKNIQKDDNTDSNGKDSDSDESGWYAQK